MDILRRVFFHRYLWGWMLLLNKGHGGVEDRLGLGRERRKMTLRFPDYEEVEPYGLLSQVDNSLRK